MSGANDSEAVSAMELMIADSHVLRSTPAPHSTLNIAPCTPARISDSFPFNPPGHSRPGFTLEIQIEILCNLDVYDILRLRMVCRWLHDITHARPIWQSLIRRSHLPISPLPCIDVPPSSLDEEYLLLSSLAMKAAWDCGKPVMSAYTALELEDLILSLELLPGGRHRVVISDYQSAFKGFASMSVHQLDRQGHAHSFEIYRGATLKTLFCTKAKYLTYKGRRGVMIALAGVSNIDVFPNEEDAFVAVHFVSFDGNEHSGVVYWIPLRLKKKILQIDLAEIDNHACMGLAFEGTIEIHDLETMNRVTSVLRPPAAAEYNEEVPQTDTDEYIIKAICILPEQHELLLDSQQWDTLNVTADLLSKLVLADADDKFDVGDILVHRYTIWPERRDYSVGEEKLPSDTGYRYAIHEKSIVHVENEVYPSCTDILFFFFHHQFFRQVHPDRL
ncbi:hypothetical protein FA95DRAFT_1682622 [Auriscalpium vulgare]|uniref:Uncharacterized protein n=1 Tax=Auriscalpium vulgare TaxID=40419 RepID=A0ACB8RE70_9AGAM|nr:hypothetical protein FA95DRAFT_1682622 [Auriscalpium vulgare]